MAAAIDYSNHPLKDIPQPHPHDVLCGRGGGTNNHVGNSHWRMLVAANKQIYITLPKRQKMLLSRSIVNAVRSQMPAGRFLQKDSKTSKWFDVGDQRAQEKTSQALREGAPDIRKKVAEEKQKFDDADVDPTKKPTAETDDEKTESKESSTDTTTTASSTTTDQGDKVPSLQEETDSSAKSTNDISPVPIGTAPVTSTPNVPYPQQFHPQANGMAPGCGYPSNTAGSMYPTGYFPNSNMPAMNGYPMNMHPGMMNPGMMAHGAMQQQQMHPMYQQQQHLQQQQQQQQGYMGNMYQQAMPSAGQPQNYPQHQQNFNSTFQENGSPHQQQQGPVPTFDDLAPPPDSMDGGTSFGSMMLSDAEMLRLQTAGTSLGSTMSHKPTGGGGNITHSHVNDANKLEPIPAMGVLEPTGISFGDASMMSVGTNKKLEETGCSFGTMMSYNTIGPDMPDGGLEAIGTSFGSLSLDTTNRDTLFASLELTGGGPVIPPMHKSENRAKGNLLECSDSESEDSDSHQLSAEKSAAWEKMKTSVTHLQTSKSKGTIGSNELMPPPVTVKATLTDFQGTTVQVPEPQFQRDFSQISAFGDEDDGDGTNDPIPPPSAPLRKQESGGDEEAYFQQKFGATQSETV